MTDYSQWGEGKIIHDFFGSFQGKFLDLGAFDGVTGSNTRGLAEAGWEGVCVEAEPSAFLRLRDNCKDLWVHCIHAAIVPEAKGPVWFYDCGDQISRALPLPITAPKGLVRGGYWTGSIDARDISGIEDEFHMISLDIEGLDLPVLKSLGPVIGETQILVIEDSVPYMAFDQEYYDELLAVAAGFGLKKVLGRTTTEKDLCNTILSR